MIRIKTYVIDEVEPPPGGEGPFDYSLTYHDMLDYKDELIIRLSSQTELTSYPKSFTFRFLAPKPLRIRR